MTFQNLKELFFLYMGLMGFKNFTQQFEEERNVSK